MIGNKANLEAYKDVEETNSKTKAGPKKNIKEQIIPSARTLNRLDEQERELYKAFENKEISLEDFTECVTALEQKRALAFKSYCRATGINEEAEEVYTDREIRNAVFHGVFHNEKSCFDGHSDVPCKPMNTAVFISLVLVVSVVLLIIVN
jgi:hypothetical protein